MLRLGNHPILLRLVILTLGVVAFIPAARFLTFEYAYHSPWVLPGSALYGFRRYREEQTSASLSTSAEKCVFHLMIASRRFDEAERILAKGTSSIIPRAEGHSTVFESHALAGDERDRAVVGLIADGNHALEDAMVECGQVTEGYGVRPALR